ncbi:putative DNA helicase [Helianthus annuus]|nr:putative DNA helicase [Helianthus annuus]
MVLGSLTGKPSASSFSIKFDLRSDPGVERNYGRLLLEMVYSYMDAIVNSWNETGILKVSAAFLQN